jgi:hypothetical protein
MLPAAWLTALRKNDPPSSEWVADALAACPHVPAPTWQALENLVVNEAETIGTIWAAIVELEKDSPDHFCAGPPAEYENDFTKICQLDDGLTRAWWTDEYPSGTPNPATRAFRDLTTGAIGAPTSGSIGRLGTHRSFAGFQSDLDPADDLHVQLNRTGLEVQFGYWVRVSYAATGCRDVAVPTVIDAGAYPPSLPSAANADTGMTRPLNGAARGMREVVHRPVDCVAHGVVVSIVGEIP